MPTTTTWEPTQTPTEQPTAYDSEVFFSAGSTMDGAEVYKARQQIGSTAYSLTSHASTKEAAGLPYMPDGITWGMSAGAKKLFYADYNRGTVTSCDFDGRNKEKVIEGLTNPKSVSVAMGSNWIFIGSAHRKQGITRCETTGERCKVLVDMVPGITGIKAAGSFVYFVSEDTGELYRIDLNGDHFTTVASGLSKPQGVTYQPGSVLRPWALDDEFPVGFKNGHLYVLTETEILRMSKTGNKQAVIVSDLNQGYGIDIDIPNGKLVFSDYNGTGIYESGFLGDDVTLFIEKANTRAICFYTSYAAETDAPSEVPTHAPTPKPTFTWDPTPTPTPPPTPLPTVEPTYILGTVLFSAGDAASGAETPLFKYVTSTQEFARLGAMKDQVVAGFDVARGNVEGAETSVYFTDSYRGELYKVPLVGEFMGDPVLQATGCGEAGSVVIPYASDYVYFACRGFDGFSGVWNSSKASIVRKKLNDTDAAPEVVAEDMGAISAIAADNYFLYFVTTKGEYKSIDLAGSGYQRLGFDIKSPTGLVLSAKAYDISNVLYLSTPNAIYRMSLDGTTRYKIIGGLVDAMDLALDLSHGKLLWTDAAAGSIFEAGLDGSHIRAVLDVKYGYKVQYYTDTEALYTGRPSKTPTRLPTPSPSFTLTPTQVPSPAPSSAPSMAPTYFGGRLYFSAGADRSGSFLYMSSVGSSETPIQLTRSPAGGELKLQEARGVSWCEAPNFVFWVNAEDNTVHRAKMNDKAISSKVIFESGGFPLYDLVASDTHVYVTSGAKNSITRMRHDGSSAKTLTMGIDKVSGIDYSAYGKGNKLFFASRAERKVYSIKDSGEGRSVLLSDVDANDVAYDREYGKLYVICDTEVWLTDEDGANPVKLISGFTHATSAAIQYGEHRLWVADYGAGVIYQAELNGAGLTARVHVEKPRYVSFYASTAADSEAPSLRPTAGPVFLPSPTPSTAPTHGPTASPSPGPSYSVEPTHKPTPSPSLAPTTGPTPYPSTAPTDAPSLAPTVTPNYLFYATVGGDDGSSGEIHRSSPDGTASEVFYSGDGSPSGLAVQFDAVKLFWTDTQNGAIYRTNVGNGGDAGVVEAVVSGLTHPKKVAVSMVGSADADGPHLFWSDPEEGALYRSGVDGGGVVALVTGVPGISGVTCTYDYVYYTVPSEDSIYRVGFSYGVDTGDDDGDDGDDDSAEAPTQVLIGVCDSPDDLTYSPQTFLMYCACATSVLNVKVYKQQGLYDNPLEVIVTGLPSSGDNAVLYNWDAAGLYFGASNASKVYFMANDEIYIRGDDDAAYDLDSALAADVTELVDLAGSAEETRGLALFDSGVISAGMLSATAQALMKDPAMLFAAPDDTLGSDTAHPLTDERTVLPLRDGSHEPAQKKSAATARQALASLAEENENEEQGAGGYGSSSTVVPLVAGAVAVFAAIALGGRGRRPEEQGKGFVPREGYAAVE